MTKKLFAVLDRVQETWPHGACLLMVKPILTPWSVDAAYRVVAAWSNQERDAYRRQLPALVTSLAALHRQWCVSVTLAVVLGLLITAVAMPVAAVDDNAAGILVSVLAAVLLPPLAIYNGIVRDCVAAQALLAACAAVHTSAGARGPHAP